MADFSRKYLEKRVKRDFGRNHFDEAMEIVDAYGGKTSEKGGPMVQLACVVQAHGDVEMLRKMVEQARSSQSGLAEVEQLHLGLDHAVLGKRLGQKWFLPEPVTFFASRSQN